MTGAKSTHGGARPGAGAKPKGPQPRNINRNCMVSADVDKWIDRHYTSAGEAMEALVRQKMAEPGIDTSTEF